MDDAVVIGSGPNGMAAAVTLARAGLSVRVLEKEDSIGGAARTLPLTLSGFRHDVGAAIHPLALASPFFRAFELDRRIQLTVPDVSYAQPLAGAAGAAAYRSLGRTAAELGRDGSAWVRLFGPLVRHIDSVTDFTANQMLRLPRSPVTAARFGLRALEQGSPLWNVRFREARAPALLTGVIGHSIGRIPSLASAAVGLVLAAHGHARGWPVPIGGSQAIIDAMADDLVAHGGVIETGVEVTDLRELAGARIVIADTSARALARIGRSVLPRRYARRLDRLKYGDGVAKVDFALSGPVPWAYEPARRSPTVHLGGTRWEIRAAEAAVASGVTAEAPYVLVSQPTIVDPSRAPAGRHVLWAYIHVPHGSAHDPTADVMRMVESAAPGFRDLVLASNAYTAHQLERLDPNLVGGDISAGAITLPQLIARPRLSPHPWRTPVRGVYLGSSSTPPASGVHGLSGFYAARLALRDICDLATPDLRLR
ncbi:NAD(P)/FAD-dependent oxidoreductase [Microbacterium sp. CFH 31415]|uniref:phytoene desaturase family protein n=1 Tax=Microbacterium sp. CFH 31415 TaxID=2921732 RepID=UPI001F133ECC|nr:NAD(P)/FAD-dependent oxidoreductase [Microbacterium sp. CFH 31415]MCH6230767.1 NAD(P)/FAD-dependent oxidoreductase [Microbacterium sp. CFH 31415]